MMSDGHQIVSDFAFCHKKFIILALEIITNSVRSLVENLENSLEVFGKKFCNKTYNRR